MRSAIYTVGDEALLSTAATWPSDDSEAIQQFKKLAAQECQLREEGRRLRIALRRARPAASIAGTLHQDLFGGSAASISAPTAVQSAGVDEAPADAAPASTAEGSGTAEEAADLQMRLEHVEAIESHIASEVATLKDRYRLQQELEAEAARLMAMLRPGADETPAARAGLAPTTREVRMTREIVELRQWKSLLDKQASELRKLVGNVKRPRGGEHTTAGIEPGSTPAPTDTSATDVDTSGFLGDGVPDFALSPTKASAQGSAAFTPADRFSMEQSRSPALATPGPGTPRPTASPGTPRPAAARTPQPGAERGSQRQEVRRLQQLDFVTRRLHEVLRSRSGTPATGASSPLAPTDSAPSSVCGTSFSAKSELLEQHVQAFYERFLLRRR